MSPDFNPIEHVWDGLGRANSQPNPSSQDPPGDKSCTFGRMGFVATSIY